MTEFEQLEYEIVKFMRGKYRLDEVAGMFYDIPCIKFRQGKKTVVSINLYGDHYVFQIILGKAERERFETIRHEFPVEIQELYDGEKTLHDGKWLFLRVDNVRDFEVIKKLIIIKKKPNRRSLKSKNAVYGKCGHRCDLCVHYTEMCEEVRNRIVPHLSKVYDNSDWSMRCTGCDTPGCQCYTVNDVCVPLMCLKEKKGRSCFACNLYPCENATVGYKRLEHKNISSDDVTWAILPYVPHQYEE